MDFDYLWFLFGTCAGIAIAVWGLFQLGAFLGMQWYVSAVAILLMGRFLIGQLVR